MAETQSGLRPSTQATSSVNSSASIERAPTRGLAAFLRKRLLAQLALFEDCRFEIQDGDEQFTVGAADAAIQTSLTVHDPELYLMLAVAGTVGAGEAYMEGFWSCSDLTALMRGFVRNRLLMDRMERGSARIAGLALKLLHQFRRNTRSGSRRNIAAHYDLGNDLFELFLDENMMYSSAVYSRDDLSLEQASRDKLDRICQKLELGPQDRVVEIGTGWGGFALHAARHYGCHVTTTTISQEQFQLARRRIDEAGLADRITLLDRDYRELTGQYDKLVSIEMIEAVGHQFLPTYLRQVCQLLKPDGMALIQAITIEDQRYEQARDSVDFIKRFIFPGSFIPSLTAILNAATQASELRLFHLEDLGESYAKTLEAWRLRFLDKLPRVRQLGYPARFERMWEFYLCYCEAGFLERAISNAQLLFVKPGNRRGPLLPSLQSGT